MIDNQFNCKIILFAFLTLSLLSCKKDSSELNAGLEKGVKSAQVSVASAIMVTQELQAWEYSTLAFYEASDSQMPLHFSTSDLQRLGDLIGRSSFDSAAAMSGLPVSQLQSLRNKYYTAYSQHYYATHPQESYANISSEQALGKGVVTPTYIPPPTCLEELNLCRDNARMII